jgi:replicative DNA helicase
MSSTAGNRESLPHDHLVEQALLGSLLIDRDAILTASKIVSEDDFFVPSHRLIYAAIIRLMKRRVPPDIITVGAEMRLRHPAAGIDEAYLSTLTSTVPTAVHAEHYAQIIAGLSARRRLIDTSINVATVAGDTRIDLGKVILETKTSMARIERKLSQDNFASIASLRSRCLPSGQQRGVESGIIDLDNLTDGFHPGELIIIAARPGVGKSALATSIALNAAIAQGMSVALFSLEMSGDQVVMRMLSVLTGIPSHLIRRGQLDKYQWYAVADAYYRLGRLPILIDDTVMISIEELARRVSSTASSRRIDLVIVDYLQLIYGSKPDNRVQELADISRGLKAMARDAGCPVIALSQLSRGIERRSDRTPRLSDLRESGALEQDADMVIFLMREELWDIAAPSRGVAELYLAKNRNGPIGSVSVRFDHGTTSFFNLEVSDE